MPSDTGAAPVLTRAIEVAVPAVATVPSVAAPLMAARVVAAPVLVPPPQKPPNKPNANSIMSFLDDAVQEVEEESERKLVADLAADDENETEKEDEKEDEKEEEEGEMEEEEEEEESGMGSAMDDKLFAAAARQLEIERNKKPPASPPAPAVALLRPVAVEAASSEVVEVMDFEEMPSSPVKKAPMAEPVVEPIVEPKRDPKPVPKPEPKPPKPVPQSGGVFQAQSKAEGRDDKESPSKSDRGGSEKTQDKSSIEVFEFMDESSFDD